MPPISDGRGPDDDRSDAALLAAHVSGDQSAFEELFRRHRTRLLRTARGRGASAEDADDTLQEAMLSAHRAAGSFRNEAAVGSWLHRIALNACTDVLRRNSGGVSLLRPEDAGATPDRSIQVETALDVRKALMQLPADQRAAVLTVDMQGYSVSDAAALLNVPEGTVKSRCSRARRRLAVLLHQFSPVSVSPVSVR